MFLRECLSYVHFSNRFKKEFKFYNSYSEDIYFVCAHVSNDMIQRSVKCLNELTADTPLVRVSKYRWEQGLQFKSDALD